MRETKPIIVTRLLLLLLLDGREKIPGRDSRRIVLYVQMREYGRVHMGPRVAKKRTCACQSPVRTQGEWKF